MTPDYPIGIIGNGDVTTAKSVRHYSPGMIRTVLDLAEWCLGAGAKIEPLRALWIAPGSDIAELAKSPEFWQVNDPTWHAFTTGPQGAAVPDVAAIRRDGTGKWEREATIYAGLDSRWMLYTLGPEKTPHRFYLEMIGAYERLLGPARLSPASTALALLERINGHSTRVGWMDALSRDVLDNTPWPQNRAPAHANPFVSDGAYVHVFDKRSAYMASSLGRFGRGDPYHEINEGQDSASPLSYPIEWATWIKTEQPALWCISAEAPDDVYPLNWEALPSPFNTHDDQPDHEWYYTPQVKLALDMGYKVRLHEVYVWKHAHQTLKDWVQRLWAARQATRGTPTEDMIKASFTQSLGILARRPDANEAIRWYHQPGWAGTLTAQHYMLQVKKIMQIDAALGGDKYLAVSTDSFAVVSNQADPVEAMPPGWAGPDGRMGQYRHVATYGGDKALTLIRMAREGGRSARLYKTMNGWDEDGEDDNR